MKMTDTFFPLIVPIVQKIISFIAGIVLLNITQLKKYIKKIGFGITAKFLTLFGMNDIND